MARTNLAWFVLEERGPNTLHSATAGAERSPPLLTTATLSAFEISLPYAALPANFRDAITITRELGIRYLWIDSLCILQDSKQDWEQESKEMGHVYRDSTLTISAMASSGSSVGILRPDPSPLPMPRPTILKVLSDNGDFVEIKVERKPFGEEDLALLDMRGPLSSRGWTLQESVLSPRHLFYGKRQIYWRCPAGFQSADGLPPGRKSPPYVFDDIASVLFSDILNQPPKEVPDVSVLLRDYYDLVQTYSHRKLTFASDKLPAFSGLAQRLHPTLGGDYLAGIWSSDIRCGLLWHSEVNYCEHVKPYRAPSWSWAVTDGMVIFPNHMLRPSPSDMRAAI